MRAATQWKRWSVAGDLVKSFQFRTGVQSDKICILNAVWERELGPLAKHWILTGVRRGVLFVKPASAAAAQELSMRAPEVLRNLNKHFSRPWLKAVRPSVK